MTKRFALQKSRCLPPRKNSAKGANLGGVSGKNSENPAIGGVSPAKNPALEARFTAKLAQRFAAARAKLAAKNIAPLVEKIAALPTPKNPTLSLGRAVEVDFSATECEREAIFAAANALKPWRKGPFKILDINIESEWDSAIKYALIEPHLDLEGRNVADIGCANGYYMFRMLSKKPRKLVGFDPSALCKCQFDFVNRFARAPLGFEMLGLEDLAAYCEGVGAKFDVILCLGVIYHRLSPIEALKTLKNALNCGGELILDSLLLESPEPIALSPLSYAKMKNAYFIPSQSALENWLKRAGFRHIEVLAVKKTTSEEQRKTRWSGGESLADFLDSALERTIEGHQAPIRIYLKARI